MTDEERQRAMDFIVEHQARFSVEMDRLEAAHSRAEGRLDRVELIDIVREGRNGKST